MKRFVLALTLSGLLSVHAGAEPSAPGHSEATLLQGFALARCLGRTLPAIKAEAEAAAGGYVERGAVAFEAYEEIDEAAAAFTERAYDSRTGADLSVMQCFDFISSEELAPIVSRHARGGG